MAPNCYSQPPLPRLVKYLLSCRLISTSAVLSSIHLQLTCDRRRTEPDCDHHIVITAVPPKDLYQHRDGRGYFDYFPPGAASEKPPAENAAAAPTAGLLKTLTDPLWRFFGSAPLPNPPPPPPPPPPASKFRRSQQRSHSYAGHPVPVVASQELVIARPPQELKGAASALLSYLPALSTISSLGIPAIPLPAFLTPKPDPPPQLSAEVLDTMIRYLAIYTEHAVSPPSKATTERLKVQASRLMMGMSKHGSHNLHEYLVILKRTPDVTIAFDSRMLERYSRGDV